MINIPNTLKQACNSDKLTYREYVVLSGTTTQIDVMTEMYATAYKDTHFIGSFNMKYIKFTTSNDVKYRNKELTLYKEINGESFKVGNFIVTEIKNNDSNEEVTVTAYDYGLKFAQPYVTALDYVSGNVTLKDVLDEICNNVGVQLVNTTLTNGDFIVDSNQFVNGEMYGDVISAIAFISGNFATITNDDKLELVFTKVTDEIIEDYVDLEDKRDTRPITSLSIGTSAVQGQNAVIKDESLIEQYGEHWLEINDVPFAYTLEKREQLKQAIFDKVKGFGYSSFKSEYAFKPYLTLGDLIQFRNKEGQLVNSIVLRITSKYDNVILEAPSVTDASIEYESPQSAYDLAKRAEVIANQNTAEIQAIATKVVDISNEKIGSGIIVLEDCNETPLYQLRITGNDSVLFPNNNLYPNDNLYIKETILIVNEGTENQKTYNLGFETLRTLGNVYDEYLMINGKATLTQRIGANEDGNLYILDEPKIIDLGEIYIELKEGTNTLKMPSFIFTFVLKVTYLLKNYYTNVFANQAQVASEIKVASDEINLEVRKKVDNTEVVSTINQSPDKISLQSNRIEINSTYFKLYEDGSIESTSGKIGGFNLEEDNFNAQVKTDLGFSLNTQEEFTNITTKINNYISGNGTLSEEELKLYDINDDGIVDRYDLLRIQRIFFGYEKLNGTFKIDATDGTKTLVFYDELGNSLGYIGLNGMKTYNLTTEYASITNSLSVNNLTVNGNFTNNSDRRLKHNIKELDDKYVNIIKELKPVSFMYNQNNSQHIGFIAQDMEKVFKENNLEALPIKVDENGMYSIDYISLIGILWKDNQELHKMIEELKTKGE